MGQEIVDGIHRGRRFDATQRRIRLQGRVGHRRHGSEQCIATPGLVVLRRQGVRRRAGGRVERIVRVQQVGELAAIDIPKEVLLDRVFRVSKDGARRGLRQIQGGRGLFPGRRSRHQRSVIERRGETWFIVQSRNDGCLGSSKWDKSNRIVTWERRGNGGNDDAKSRLSHRFKDIAAGNRRVLQTKETSFDVLSTAKRDKTN
jgi:hypothetical protein